jgi:flagellar biosynthesis GTPase FlhF
VKAAVDAIAGKVEPEELAALAEAMEAFVEPVGDEEPDAAKDEEAAEDEDETAKDEEPKAEDEDEAAQDEDPALDEDALKAAADACDADPEDPAFQKAFAEGVKYGEKLEKDPAEREKLDREHESEGMKEAMDEEDVKEAMDAAIRKGASRGEARVVARFRTLSKAAEAVRPVLGPVDVFSFDSASDIYGAALRRMGVDVRRHPRSAWRSIFEVSRQQQAQASMAQDSSMRRDFSGPFAGLNRIKH